MAFERELWEAALVDNYHETSVLTAITTAPTDMTAASITFNRVNAGTISDYEGTVNWEDVDATPIELTFDNKKYFAVTVSDIEKAQTNIDIIDGVMGEQAKLISETTDTYAFAKFVAGAGTALTATISDANDMYDAIVDLGAALGKKKVPVTDRYIVLGWDALGYVQKDDRFGRNYEVLENGIVTGSKINGMTLVVTANLDEGTVLAMHKSAVGFGEQINELEGMRLQDKFADGIRGLSVAGAVVLNPDGVATMSYTTA